MSTGHGHTSPAGRWERMTEWVTDWADEVRWWVRHPVLARRARQIDDLLLHLHAFPESWGGESEMSVVGGASLRHHPLSACSGRHCCIHNPSDHPLRDAPLHWRSDRGIMERICPDRGIGHPDPDDLAFRISQGADPEFAGIHGCDGCCSGGSFE